MSATAPIELVVVGSCMTDLITTVPRLPELGETLVGTDFSTGFGGKGANQAVMAARFGIGVAMVARLGADDFGHATLDNFRAQGVDARHVRILEGVPSGVAPITVREDGQNTVLIVPGANERMDAAAVDEAADLIGDARVVLCQLEIPDEAISTAFETAKRRGVRTVLNPAPARELPRDLLELADLIAPNETELALLTGAAVDDLTEVEAGARQLRVRPDQIVIVTLGARGALVLEGEVSYHVAAESVRAVDSTGAGDAFVGTLSAALARDVPLRDAVAWSCRVATASVRKPGTQTSFPDVNELRALDIELPR